MSEPPIVIQPVKPPLSHLTQRQRRSRNWRAPVLTGLVAVAALAALYWVFSFDAPAVRLVDTTGQNGARPAPEPKRQERAPFADLEHERQLEAAKSRLGELVETQSALKESMQVGLWGERDYQAAMDRATEGDLAFQEKRYEDAWVAYGDATAQFKALRQRGEDLFDAHLQAGAAALDRRDGPAAEREFGAAAVIKADDPAAQAGLARAQKIPAVTEALRKAANHELAGRWQEALSAYDEVLQLDPQTLGVAELRARVGRAANEEQVRKHLSDGFAALDSRQHEKARNAFNRALALDPDNTVAAGALQQVGAQGDIDRIKAGEARGLAAEAREDWAGARQAYDEVLAIDGAIEFAKTGRVRAQAHARALDELARIRATPEKLSAPQRFQDARQTLAEARSLSPGGPKLTEHINAVDQLLRIYAEPVEVTLTSDGATAIVLSTVGALGTFSRKTVSLRPGEYTVVGSQQGCRDVRQTIVVKPDMPVVSVRCLEPLNGP